MAKRINLITTIKYTTMKVIDINKVTEKEKQLLESSEWYKYRPQELERKIDEYNRRRKGVKDQPFGTT